MRFHLLTKVGYLKCVSVWQVGVETIQHRCHASCSGSSSYWYCSERITDCEELYEFTTNFQALPRVLAETNYDGTRSKVYPSSPFREEGSGSHSQKTYSSMLHLRVYVSHLPHSLLLPILDSGLVVFLQNAEMDDHKETRLDRREASPLFCTSLISFCTSSESLSLVNM